MLENYIKDGKLAEFPLIEAKRQTKNVAKEETNITLPIMVKVDSKLIKEEPKNQNVHKEEPSNEKQSEIDLQNFPQAMESVFVDIKVEKNEDEWMEMNSHIKEAICTVDSDEAYSAEGLDNDNSSNVWNTSASEKDVDANVSDDAAEIHTQSSASVSEDSLSSIVINENKTEFGTRRTKFKTSTSKDAAKKKKSITKKTGRILKKCLLCQRNYQNHKNHILTYHSNIERPYECFICHKNYKKIEHLRFHFRTHRNERNFICHLCGESYLLNSDLTKHIYNRHCDIRPHSCELCSKRFKNRHAMQIHLRVHSGEKPFICTVCSEPFAAMSSLKIHERRHTGLNKTYFNFILFFISIFFVITGLKPYVCNYCHKGFSDHSTHRQHVRIHTGAYN